MAFLPVFNCFQSKEWSFNKITYHFVDFFAIIKNTSNPVKNHRTDAIFALSLKKYIKRIQLAAPIMGIIGNKGTLNGLSILGLDFLNFMRERWTNK